MSDWFSGKLCIVTGAAQGIGKALAEKYAENGAVLVLLDRQDETLRKTTSEIKDR
jgi:short-subunit dehydrogenase